MFYGRLTSSKSATTQTTSSQQQLPHGQTHYQQRYSQQNQLQRPSTPLPQAQPRQSALVTAGSGYRPRHSRHVHFPPSPNGYTQPQPPSPRPQPSQPPVQTRYHQQLPQQQQYPNPQSLREQHLKQQAQLLQYQRAQTLQQLQLNTQLLTPNYSRSFSQASHYVGAAGARGAHGGSEQKESIQGMLNNFSKALGKSANAFN